MKKKIHQYTVFFESNENKGYTVTVPALPGLVTEGKNFDDARMMAEDAIRCYVEGLAKIKEQAPEEKESVQLRLAVAV